MKDLYDSEQMQNAMKLIGYFEENFTCSGVCEPSLFYFTLPLADGPPTTTCLSHMKGVIANNLTYMGMVSTLCGLLMLFTWLCQYCLWKNYEEK